jgi:poly-gamma-glutamate synthesis protein (capsule biosynthesis protein)
LANNHILNFGWQGLASTKKYLDEAGIEYFGAPNGQRNIIKEINGVKIGFISYNEFYGHNEEEEKLVIEEIEKIKTETDLVIIFSHWGPEYRLTPTDAVKELAHKFINGGADLIIGSHPHVSEPMEEYNGKRIYYSLGNFVFDQYFDEDVRNGMGVVVKVNLETKQLNFEEIKFYLQSGGQTIELNNQ